MQIWHELCCFIIGVIFIGITIWSVLSLFKIEKYFDEEDKEDRVPRLIAFAVVPILFSSCAYNLILMKTDKFIFISILCMFYGMLVLKQKYKNTRLFGILMIALAVNVLILI